MQFYGFLSNGCTAALVGPDASIDWLPMPRFDSPSIFTRLLGDERHGFFAITGEGVKVTGQRYLEGTNILETVMEGPSGRATICDYLTVGRTELRRLITSEMALTVMVAPVFGYGLVAPAVQPCGRGAVFQNPLEGEALVFAVCGTPSESAAPITGDPVVGRWDIPPGRYDLILRYIADDKREGSEAMAALVEDAAAVEAALEQERPHVSLQTNIKYWKDRLAAVRRGPYHAALERSLLVLYGLTYRTNGAIIAAPTTSLPETLGESRQWDYRFAWIRDGSYAAEALLAAGDPVSARRFLEFLLNCVDLQDKPFQAPFFHVDGTLIRGERDLGWLPGYRHSRPCREGNAASHQQQLDVEGDFLWTVYRYVQTTGDQAFLHFYWNLVQTITDWVAHNWHQKDASLWEFRDRDDHYTHSKLMCWVALHYGAELASMVGQTARAESWEAQATKVQAVIESRAFNTRLGFYAQALGGDKLDAAVLLMPLYGYCDANHPRFVSTVKAIEAKLVRGSWVYRYADDMLGKASHPFVLATSWLARVYLRQGEISRARRLIDGLLSNQSDLGLLGEHADIETGEPRGNFPQGFSHLGLIMAVLELDAQKAVQITA